VFLFFEKICISVHIKVPSLNFLTLSSADKLPFYSFKKTKKKINGGLLNMGQKIKNFCPRFSAPMSLKNKFFLDFFVYFLEVLLFYPLNSSRYPYVRIYLKILQKKMFHLPP